MNYDGTCNCCLNSKDAYTNIIKGPNYNLYKSPPLPPKTNISKENEFCSGKNCSGYRGKLSKTKSGRTCQAWDTDKPQKRHYKPSRNPKSGLVNNYCRNPSPKTSKVIWCYTTDPKKRWESCELPKPVVDAAIIKVNGKQIIISKDVTGGKGINVVALNGRNHKVIFKRAFYRDDRHIVSKIKSLPKGSIVIVA